jgi:hypothetical protein
MSKLVVYAVGDLVTDIVEGDSILVDQVSYQEDC